MKRLALGLALAFLFGSASFAASIDGNLSDWGVTPGSQWNNTVGARQWTEPAVGSDGYVGPGYGGQPFNVEAAYVRTDGTYFYYAVVTGFANTGETNSGYKYYPGDIFIDFQPSYVLSNSTYPTGTMDFAIETTSYDTTNFLHGGKVSQGQGAGSFYSNVTINLAADEWDGVYYPVEIRRSGVQQLAVGTLVGMTDFAYNDDFYGSDHYVMEGRIPLAYFGNVAGSSGYIWWTMQCANDYGQLGFSIPVGNVPEPGTLALAGTGFLFGLGFWARRRMR